MRYISLFSGIEAASVAWKDLEGWEPIAFSEIDKFPSAVLDYRFPNVPNLGDITKIDWNEVLERYGAIDLIVGGSPCQSFSIAGNRKSLDGESNLMFEYLRAIESVKPKWLVWENVPGVLNTKDDAFGQLLRTLQEIGYCDLAYRVFDAQFFGVAQRRRRVFLVGYLAGGGFRSTAVLFDTESLQGADTSNRDKRKAIIAEIDECSRESCPVCVTNDTSHAAIDNDLCGTLLAGGGLSTDSDLVLSNEDDVIGTLAARDYRGLCADDMEAGKCVLEKFTH